MRWKTMTYLGVAVLVTIVLLGWKLTVRTAYESAEYRVLEADGPFEIREYPDLTLATTEVLVDSSGSDRRFSRLFQYIRGANDNNQKVAMTTPVFMASQGGENQGQMGFVMPKQLSQQRVPEPSDPSVEVRKRKGGRFAVMRYAGRMSRDSITQSEEQLRQWIQDQGLVGDSDVESAGYDPPWTPGPFRRNEILIRIKRGVQGGISS